MGHEGKAAVRGLALRTVRAPTIHPEKGNKKTSHTYAVDWSIPLMLNLPWRNPFCASRRPFAKGGCKLM